MRIFLTALRPCQPTRSWPHSREAQLLSDTLAALHAFRFDFNIRSPDLQWSAANTPFYRLDERQHSNALVNGALLISNDEFLELVAFWHARSEASLGRLVAAAPTFAARLAWRPVPPKTPSPF